MSGRLDKTIKMTEFYFGSFILQNKLSIDSFISWTDSDIVELHFKYD